MNKQKYCVYDNPSTMCREAWIDGRKIAFLLAELIVRPDMYVCQHELLHGFGEWEAGKIQGDKDAIMFEKG